MPATRVRRSGNHRIDDALGVRAAYINRHMRQTTSGSTIYRQRTNRRGDGSVFIMLIVVWIGALVLFGFYFASPHGDDAAPTGTSCEARYQWRINTAGSEQARTALTNEYTDCVDNAG